jgi:hypothetical protein
MPFLALKRSRRIEEALRFFLVRVLNDLCFRLGRFLEREIVLGRIFERDLREILSESFELALLELSLEESEES